MKKILLLLVLLWTSNALFAQPVRYVKPASSGSGDGTSWTNASSDLQAMINASNEATNDQVWVAAGTYCPTSHLNSFIKKKLHVPPMAHNKGSSLLETFLFGHALKEKHMFFRTHLVLLHI